jgi:hypothetical protein
MVNSIRIATASALVGAALAISAAPAAATVSCVAGQAPAPAALTGSATGVSDTAATLQGSVNPNGCATTYDFEYGPTNTYGTPTAETSGGSGTSFVAATAPITGLKPNTTYHFTIVATSAGGTIDGADGTFTTKPGCVAGVTPTVVTKPATKLEPSSATVNATVNPNGCATSYEFQYGPTTGPLKTTSSHSAGSGTSPTTVSVALSGLAPSTGYVFRVVATSAGGPIDGAELSFQTPAGCVKGISLPSAITGVASSVTETTAILSGTVGPNDCTTKIHFQYGPTTTYGKSTPSHTVGSGTGTIPFAATIGGLAQGAVYHFRLVATSSAGTSYGGDLTFRTATPPVARIRIDGRRPAVRAGFLLAVHLHCTLGGADCVGSVDLFRNGRPLGRQGYAIAPGNTGVVLVSLNTRGRKLVRHHRLLRRVEVVAHSAHNTAVRFVTLVRTFRP